MFETIKAKLIKNKIEAFQEEVLRNNENNLKHIGKMKNVFYSTIGWLDASCDLLNKHLDENPKQVNAVSSLIRDMEKLIKKDKTTYKEIGKSFKDLTIENS